MRRISHLVSAVVVLVLLVATARADEVFDARGFNPNRSYFNPLPFEHVDPLNGDLLLVFNDLSLPGNANFDLKLQRTYNSKIYPSYPFGTPDADSWAGMGWSFHLGRVRTTTWDDPLSVEMPDGSSHKLFPNYVGDSGKHVTRDYWVYDRNASPPQLKLTNGIVYTFGKVVAFGSGSYYRYPTLIQDPFGNRIEITYASVAKAPDAFLKITQYLSTTQKREITFTTETVGARTRLRTMTFLGRTWTYSYMASSEAGKSLLTSVQPPVGPSWGYGYTISGGIQNELVSVTTPNGGTITYSYGTQGEGSGKLANPFRLGSTQSVLSRVVTSRTTGGRSVTGGTWTYWYAQGTSQDQTVVTVPSACTGSSVTTYTFLGVGNNYVTGSVWKIGLLESREVKQGSTTLESEHLEWRNPAANDYISPVTEIVGPNHDVGIYAPVVAKRTVTRFSQSYVATNTYHSQAYSVNGPNFNDYGRPYQVQESGDLSRKTMRSFQYGFTPYIVDKVASETITSGEAFTKSWGYNLATGFVNSEIIYGIQTTYAPTADGLGNVGSRTNANGHMTRFAYDWGVLNGISPPVPGTGTTRLINPEGTMASETQRGFTTTFLYDNLFRPTRRTPPVGNATFTSYDNTGGVWVQVTRGSSSTTATVDGFGRTVLTNNSLSVQTTNGYDTCGRKTYESYPSPSTPGTGTAYAYDALGRVTRKTNPDSSFVNYAYSTTNGIDVTITDENGHATLQDWSAFGDPRDARLVAVTDARGAKFSYSYNALGSLRGVTETGGGGGPAAGRTWHYNDKNQLDAETHPETGIVTYTYYAAGNLHVKTDAAFGQTTYSYDENERLTGIDRPGTFYDTTIGYDGSDNRTRLVNGYVTITFGFDGANRLTSRQDVVNGQTLTTGYTPDANDNVQRIDYPSGNAVVYTYDSENRISTVKNGPGAVTYADTFTYHPSGRPLSFKPGGPANPNSAQTFTYDNRYRLKTLVTGLRSLTYGYDKVGNATSITEGTRSGRTTRPSIGYDEIDRLTSVSGFAPGSYVYDALGNRTSSTVAQTPASYTYGSATARLTSFTGSGTLVYDGNGNLTNDGRAYSYTPENLLEVVGPPAAPVATYRYDGDNLRTMKIDGVSGSKRYYVHGPGGQILTEFEEPCAGHRQLVRDYVYAAGRLLADVKPAVPAVRVGFVQPSSSLSEAGGGLNVAVQITTADGSATTCPVTVRFTTADGTATAGTDYVANTGIRTFVAGSQSGDVQTIPVTLTPDNAACQGNRSFSVQLFDASGATIVSGTHTVTILEDDRVCLSGTKSVLGTFTAGGAVDYTVVVANSGTHLQRDNGGHEFTDALSSFLTLHSVTASSGTASKTGNTAFWDGPVAPGSPVTIAVHAHLNGDSALQLIANTGTISYDLHDTGSNAQAKSTNTVSFMVGSGPISFYTVTPCRVVDTRNPEGTVGGPSLSAGSSRVFPITGSCGIPAGAVSVSLNVTVVSRTWPGSVVLYPAGITAPGTSTVNYRPSSVRGNNAVVLLNGGQLEALCRQAAGTTDLVIDVNGYFQ